MVDNPSPNTGDPIGGGGETLNGFKFKGPSNSQLTEVGVVVHVTNAPWPDNPDATVTGYFARNVEVRDGESAYYAQDDAPNLPQVDCVDSIAMYPGPIDEAVPLTPPLFIPVYPPTMGGNAVNSIGDPMTSETPWMDVGKGVQLEPDSSSGWRWVGYVV